MKVQEPTPQHSLAKAVEQSYWMMFLAITLKQSLPPVAMMPPPLIVPIERMLVSGVMVSDDYDSQESFMLNMEEEYKRGMGRPENGTTGNS